MLVVLFPSDVKMRETGDRGGDDTDHFKSVMVGVFTPWKLENVMPTSTDSVAPHLLHL